MKHLLYIYLILITNSIIAQDAPETISLDIEDYDISALWLTERPRLYEGEAIRKSEPVGYFGDNYQRFYMHYISAIQNSDNKREYFIYGKNKLKGNISEVQGIFSIDSAYVFKEEYEKGVQEGIIVGTYQLFEDRKKKGTGMFAGSFVTTIMMVNNEISYSTLYWYADGYMNNQFEGTWTSYLSGKKYTCNWGDYRIPGRRGFDIGAGEMGVNSKYIKNGWENFELATFPISTSDEHRKQIEAAKTIEAEEWWK